MNDNMPVGSKVVLLIAVLALCGCRHASVRAPSPEDEQEAIIVLQGTDTVELFSPRVVTLVAIAIHDIRQAHPEVSGIHARVERPAIAMTVTDDSTTTQTKAYPGSVHLWNPHPRMVRRTGIVAIDSVLDDLHVDSVSIMPPESMLTLEVSFANAANAPVIARRFARVPHVANVVDDGPVETDSTWVRLRREGSLFHFLFSVGQGYCQAGCRERKYFTYTFDTVSKKITRG
jgi:hypothetical protein